MVNPLGLKNPRHVPPKIWYPIIDQGTLEDDEFLRTKYAALLANAVDHDFRFGIRPAFVEILKQLTATEAKFIDDLYADVVLQPQAGYVVSVGGPEIARIIESTRLGEEEAILVLKALARHGLLEMIAHAQTYTKLLSVAPHERLLQLDRFGYEFVAACRPPSNAENKPDLRGTEIRQHFGNA